MIYIYNKLVRDKIPDNIVKKGHKCSYKKLDDNEYKKELDKKLLEEVNEFIADHNIEEMADIMTVVNSLMKEYNLSYEDVKLEMERKKEKNGGFDNKLYLVSVEEYEKER